MAKPVLFVVDDEPEELGLLEHDLEEKYSDRFHLMGVGSSKTALEDLKRLRLQNQPVALFLVDQRMPEMNGMDFLKQTKQLYPEAKRVLLTSYGDITVAIQAINEAKVDYYLMKPWAPPQDHLYPELDDLLADWLACFRPPFEGVRLIGNRWSPKSYRIRDFLACNLVPYQWLDIEQGTEAKQLLKYLGTESKKLPVVIFSDGTYLIDPTIIQVAEKVHLKIHAESKFYDLIIVGSGPAGLAAAVYGASEGLRTLMIERKAPGGQAGSTSRIENYLGFPAGLTGEDLARRAVLQAEKFGTEILTPREVTGVRVEGQYRCVEMGQAAEISCHALLIATGVSYRQLDVPGIERLKGAGVYYGASTTEAMSCSEEEVYIVGGANSAGQAAIYFSSYARSVTMLVRGNSLSKSMSQYLIDEIEERENITVLLHTRVVAVDGEKRLEAITMENDETREKKTVPTSSLFIFIGAEPHTEWLAGLVERDEKGFILTGPDLMHEGQPPKGWPLKRNPFMLETSVPGIFAAGDVRHGSIKRVASSVGEGAMAVQFIHRYLQEM